MVTQLERTSTIQKTLLTTLIMDGFWERWLAHGVLPEDLSRVRPRFRSLDDWVEAWEELSVEKKQKAHLFLKEEMREEAEQQFRLAALYQNINQWIYPHRTEEKQKAYQNMVQSVQSADSLSDYARVFDSIIVDNVRCEGRTGLPKRPKGIMVILNPIDSTKEELHTYESDFLKRDFITVSFDGPGQGSTYIQKHMKANNRRWKLFVDQTIDYAEQLGKAYAGALPIYLFGTSSGASWAMHGSQNKKVRKVIAVSPADSLMENRTNLPDYFVERLKEMVEGVESFLPSQKEQHVRCPVYLFHGGKDGMVTGKSIQALHQRLPKGSHLVTYEEEGHCCNNRLPEVRQLAAEWALQEGGSR